MEVMSEEERGIFASFMTQMRSLQQVEPSVAATGAAGDIIGVCLGQMRSQRAALLDIEQSLVQFMERTHAKLEAERNTVDANIEYIEARMNAHPEFVRRPQPDLEFRRKQLFRENHTMCIAAEAYIRCVGSYGHKPTLESLIAALKNDIPESMVRKSYNLTKVAKFLNTHAEIFPRPV
uniref:Uncharacterized protein n=1 Tax=viral metagenome TaxID=1070528 RepID=A0A6C0KBS0_9ZZZZ